MSKKQKNINSTCFRPGDYVAAFWIDSSGKYEWHLANLVEICSNDTFLLSYFRKIGHSKEGQIRVSPEVTEVIKTDKYQVISRSIDVSYFRSSRIKCCINKETILSLNTALKKKIQSD